jgi:hypothetical protein
MHSRKEREDMLVTERVPDGCFMIQALTSLGGIRLFGDI